MELISFLATALDPLCGCSTPYLGCFYLFRSRDAVPVDLKKERFCWTGCIGVAGCPWGYRAGQLGH